MRQGAEEDRRTGHEVDSNLWKRGGGEKKRGGGEGGSKEGDDERRILGDEQMRMREGEVERSK